jgi:hypothetical protein
MMKRGAVDLKRSSGDFPEGKKLDSRSLQSGIESTPAARSEQVNFGGLNVRTMETESNVIFLCGNLPRSYCLCRGTGCSYHHSLPEPASNGLKVDAIKS